MDVVAVSDERAKEEDEEDVGNLFSTKAMDGFSHESNKLAAEGNTRGKLEEREDDDEVLEEEVVVEEETRRRR